MKARSVPRKVGIARALKDGFECAYLIVIITELKPEEILWKDSDHWPCLKIRTVSVKLDGLSQAFDGPNQRHEVLNKPKSAQGTPRGKMPQPNSRFIGIAIGW
jgi:hypothetical protein